MGNAPPPLRLQVADRGHGERKAYTCVTSSDPRLKSRAGHLRGMEVLHGDPPTRLRLKGGGACKGGIEPLTRRHAPCCGLNHHCRRARDCQGMACTRHSYHRLQFDGCTKAVGGTTREQPTRPALYSHAGRAVLGVQSEDALLACRCLEPRRRHAASLHVLTAWECTRSCLDVRCCKALQPQTRAHEQSP